MNGLKPYGVRHNGSQAKGTPPSVTRAGARETVGENKNFVREGRSAMKHRGRFLDEKRIKAGAGGLPRSGNESGFGGGKDACHSPQSASQATI